MPSRKMIIVTMPAAEWIIPTPQETYTVLNHQPCAANLSHIVTQSPCLVTVIERCISNRHVDSLPKHPHCDRHQPAFPCQNLRLQANCLTHQAKAVIYVLSPHVSDLKQGCIHARHV